VAILMMPVIDGCFDVQTFATFANECGYSGHFTLWSIEIPIFGAQDNEMWTQAISMSAKKFAIYQVPKPNECQFRQIIGLKY
jgi:hypothetical protein